MTRLIHVDAAHGQVLAHELRDAASGTLIGRATLQDHRRCPKTGMVLPHRIELDWPAGQTGPMTLTLGEIEVNPTDFRAVQWTMPTHHGAVRHLDAGVRTAGP